MNLKKRAISILLSLSLLLPLLPAQALAVQEDNPEPLTGEGGLAEPEPSEAGTNPDETEPESEPVLQASDDWVPYAVEGGNLYFDPASGKIVKCDQSVTSAVIPGKIGGAAVTGIARVAFTGCKNLTSVHIPEGVASIGDMAFSDCANLTSIHIPASVTSLEDTFYGCAALTSAGPIGGGYSIEFGWPEEIPASAFSQCSGLTRVHLPDTVTSIGNRAFFGCTNLTEISLPDTVTRIGDSAFSNCASLPEISIPEAVANIGEYAFYKCESLTGISIPEGVGSIAEATFGSCKALESAVIPEGVASIGAKAFSDCANLTSICIPASVDRIESTAFSGCSGLTTAGPVGGDYHIALGWREKIPDKAFSSFRSLVSVVLPATVTSIGAEAFYGCSALTDVSIPDNVISIGTSAFGYCPSLTHISIPGSVSDMGISVFSGSTGLTTAGPAGSGCSIEFGWTETIPADAFYGCKYLTSVSIPEGLSAIGKSAFADCTGLTHIAIPASVTNIGESAFAECSGLTSAGPSGGGYSVEFGWTGEIPAYAFYACKDLTSVTIPDSVSIIGEQAFCRCAGLTGVRLPNSLTGIGSSAFYGCTGLTSISLPEHVTGIGSYAFNGCTSLESVSIPVSVTSIERNAFPSALKDVYYAGTEAQWNAITTENNPSLQSAVTHFSSSIPDKPLQPDDPEADTQREVLFVRSVQWDEEKQAFDLLSSASLHTLVTGETVLEGADSAEALQGRFLLADYVPGNAPLVHQAVRVKLLEDRTGVVSSMTMRGDPYNYDFVIDGVTYQMRDAMESYGNMESQLVGRKVQYLLSDGWLIQVKRLSPGTGRIDSWEGQTATIDGKEYIVQSGTAEPLAKGTVVGFGTINSNWLDIIAEISPRTYETKTGTLTEYQASNQTAILDGTAYPVDASECASDLPSLVGEPVFFLLANGSIVHMDALEKAACRLRVTPSGYASMGIYYENGVLGMDAAGMHLGLVLSNRASYSYPKLYDRFYDKDIISRACEQTSVVVDAAAWTDCRGLVFSGPDLDGLVLQPGESKEMIYLAKPESGYAPSAKEEDIYGRLSVSWHYDNETEERSAPYRLTIHVYNRDYKPAKPQDQQKSGDVSAAARKARGELDKLSALGLDPNVLKDVFGLTNSAQKRFEQELLAIVAMSSIPESTLREKIGEVVLNKVFGKYKPDVSVKSYRIPPTYVFQTDQFGEVEARITCKVMDSRLMGVSFGKAVEVSYSILGCTRNEDRIYPKDGLLGGGAAADFSAFFSSVNSMVETELQNAFDTAWGSSANAVADFLFSKSVKKILDAGRTSVKDISWQLLVWPSKNVSINCRGKSRALDAAALADIRIYDENQTLCGSVENGAVTLNSDAFSLEVSGGTVSIAGLEDSYTVEYDAAAPGWMDIKITEYHHDGAPFRQIAHYDIPLDPGLAYTQSVTAALRQPEEDYALLSSEGDLFPVEETASLFLMEKQTLEPLDLIGWTLAADGGTRIELVDRTGVLDSGVTAWAACYEEDGRLRSLIPGSLAGEMLSFPQPLSKAWCVFLLNGSCQPLAEKTELTENLRLSGGSV